MFLPRALAIILVVISVAMLAPIGAAVIDMAAGAHVPAARWLVPLAILGTGAIMIWLLTRKSVSLQLYIIAFALWVLTAYYFFTTRVLTRIP
ncbi:MAG: hypothetical protein NVSMB68_12960 [Thermoanaerobaculia bacterium]